MSDDQNKKWKILGIQTNVEWYDVKTKFKLLLRKIFYSWLAREIITTILFLYINFVYLTSKKTFINSRYFIRNVATNHHSLIFCFWHSRLIMIPFTRRIFGGYKIITLASKHGDGRVVGDIMKKFGLIPILGSSQNNRKSSRGIDLSSLKKIINHLKSGYSLAITPDGPRGPNQKINGGVVEIAKISQRYLMPLSYSSSRCIKLKTWDRFNIPLPFGRICFYFDKNPIFVSRDVNEEKIQEIEKLLKERMDYTQDKSEKICARKTKIFSWFIKNFR